MSVEACSCEDYTLGNFGQPACAPAPGVTEKLIFAPYLNSTGVVQNILLSATLNAAFFGDHFNMYDASNVLVPAKNKWYITDLLEDYSSEKGESTFKEWQSGRKQKVKSGVRTVKVVIKGGKQGASFLLLSELVKTGCLQIGVLKVDALGNLIGNGVTDSTKLLFLKVDMGSWDAQLVEATYDTPQHIMLTFQFAANEFDSNLRMITADDMSLDLTTQTPNYVIEAAQSGTMGQTSHTVDVFHNYGSIKSPEPVPGLVTANFKYYNSTDSAAVTVTGATESTTVPGRYVLTYASQTVADVMHLQIISAGLDDANVYADSYVIGS